MGEVKTDSCLQYRRDTIKPNTIADKNYNDDLHLMVDKTNKQHAQFSVRNIIKTNYVVYSLNYSVL